MAGLKNLFAIANGLGDSRLGGLVQNPTRFANEWAAICQLARILVFALSPKRTLGCGHNDHELEFDSTLM